MTRQLRRHPTGQLVWLTTGFVIAAAVVLLWSVVSRATAVGSVPTDGVLSVHIDPETNGMDLAVTSPDGQRCVMLTGSGADSLWNRARRFCKQRRYLAFAARFFERPPSLKYDPAWSPDRRYIAFVMVDDVKKRRADLWVMRADGSGLRRLTELPNGLMAGSPTWSPDGRRIAFHIIPHDANSARTSEGEIRVITALGERSTKVRSGILPAWSPTSDEILFLSDSTGRVQVMNSRGEVLRQMPGTTPKAVYDGMPVWFPDGTRVLYTSYLREWHGATPARIGIWSSRADGSQRRLLAKTAAYVVSGLSWTRDRKSFVFTRFTDITGVPRSPNLTLLAADGSDERVLCRDECWTGGDLYTTALVHLRVELENMP